MPVLENDVGSADLGTKGLYSLCCNSRCVAYVVKLASSFQLCAEDKCISVCCITE
jgi:hypothetical protein